MSGMSLVPARGVATRGRRGTVRRSTMTAIAFIAIVTTSVNNRRKLQNYSMLVHVPQNECIRNTLSIFDGAWPIPCT